MSDRRYTGSVSLDEATPAEITVKELAWTKRTRSGAVWLFGNNLTADATIRVYVKDSGGTYRKISTYDSVLPSAEAINVLSGGPIENGTYVKITAESFGGGSGSVNLEYEIPYDDQIENMADALAAGLLQYIKDTKAILSCGRLDGHIRYVSKLGSDSLGTGMSWDSPFLTIGKAITELSGGYSEDGGYIFFSSGEYEEDISIPDGIEVIGVNSDGTFPEIRGPASGSVAPTVTLGNRSSLRKARVGKQDGDGGTTTCVIKFNGSMATIDDISTGGINSGIGMTEVIRFAGVSGVNECKVLNSWLSASGYVKNILAGAAYNCEIRENTFDNFTEDAIVVSGTIVDVEDNTFLGINTGYYGIKATCSRMNIVGNSYLGDPGSLHDSGTGLNHIVQNNFIAEEVEETLSMVAIKKASDTMLYAIEYDFTTYSKAVIKYYNADRPFGVAVPTWWAYAYNASGGNPSNASEISKRDRVKPWSTPPV